MKVRELIEHLSRLPKEAQECECEIDDVSITQDYCAGDTYTIEDAEYRMKLTPEGYVHRVIFRFE